jgi:hypothetical protein
LIFRIEDALEGFLTFQNCHKIQKEKKDVESKIGTKAQSHILRAVGEMALRASSILRNPKISKKLAFYIIL